MERRQFNMKVRDPDDLGPEIERILSDEYMDGPGSLSVRKEGEHFVIAFYTTAEIAARIAGYYTEE